MGIEFTGLDQLTQKRLQQQIETIAVESPEIGSSAEIADAWIRHRAHAIRHNSKRIE
jgi:hypothetical protein